MTPVDQFADNLRRAREASGLTQEALAVAAGVHRTEVSMLERGEREPRLTTIVKVSRALNVIPSSLLDGIK